MDDFKFPISDPPLPPKKVGTEAYLKFLISCLNRMSPEERKRQLAQRVIPTGKPFTLFPKE